MSLPRPRSHATRSRAASRMLVTLKNPDSIPLSISPARLADERFRMQSTPCSLLRPVVVLGGWRSPAIMGRSLMGKLRSLTSTRDDDFLSVSYPGAGNIEAAARAARERIERWLPTGGMRHPEIDIVAISMGGLVGRLLATGLPWENSPRAFSVRRLFTIATPHRGAALARWIRLDSAARSMRPGSAALGALDEALRDPATSPSELVCYVQRMDWYVGTWNTSPPGHALRCVKAPGPIHAALSHFTVHQHPAIIIDMARRLRGEAPLGGEDSGRG